MPLLKKGPAMPPEAKRPVAWISAISVLGILIQILMASYLWGSKIARLEEGKANRDEVVAWRAIHESAQADALRELSRWQGTVDGKLSVLLTSMERVENRMTLEEGKN